MGFASAMTDLFFTYTTHTDLRPRRIDNILLDSIIVVFSLTSIESKDSTKAFRFGA